MRKLLYIVWVCVYGAMLLTGCSYSEERNTSPDVSEMQSAAAADETEEVSEDEAGVEAEESEAVPEVDERGLEPIPQSDDPLIYRAEGDYLYLNESLEEIESRTDYIVRGILKDDAMQKLERHGDAVTWGVTVSSFEITEVYRGDLEVGDVIPIAERYYTEEENGQVYRHELGYAPSKPEEEYIFFLIYEDGEESQFLKGLYTPVGKEAGRFPVPKLQTQSIENDTENGVYEDFYLVRTKPEVYEGIYKDVIEKYLQ